MPGPGSQACPKPEPRILAKKRQKLDLSALERECRRMVKARDKGHCVVPGCKSREGVEMHHVVPRSLSKRARWLTSNNCLLCLTHHRLRHAGLITITGNADEELFIAGERKHLEFRL